MLKYWNGLGELLSQSFQLTFGEQNTENQAHDILAYSLDQGVSILDTTDIVSIDSFLPIINYPSLFSNQMMGYTSPFFLLAFTTQFQLTREIKGELIFILAGGCNQNHETR